MSRLLDAWQRWDKVCAAMPRHPHPRYAQAESREMDAACVEPAARLGISVNTLRKRLSAHRRAGRAYESCLSQAGIDE